MLTTLSRSDSELLRVIWKIQNWNFTIVVLVTGGGRFHEKSKFTEAQIAFILRQSDERTPVAEVCRKAGISDATFCKRYGGMTLLGVKWMRQLEDKNNRLQGIVADLTFDRAMFLGVVRREL